MFDFLRNIRKSAEEKRLERVNAYLDGELSPREQEQFEQELAQDEALRAEVDALRQIQMSVRQLPRVRAPRNYTLDPAVYGQPAQAQTGWQLYPALRVATALTAFFFIVALALDLMTPAGVLDQPVAGLFSPAGSSVQETAVDTAAEGEVAMEEMAVEEAEEPVEAPVEEESPAEAAPMEADAPEAEQPEVAAEETAAGVAEEVEVTRVVTEEVETAEEQAEEESEETAPAPGVAQADEVEATATLSAEATAMLEAADGDEATLALPPEGTPSADDARTFTEPTAEPLPTPDLDEAAATQDEDPEPFPWLLLAEILLGVGLVGLTVLTLIARRGG